MKLHWIAAAAAVGTALLAAAFADDPGRSLALAEEKGCFECHAIGWTNVGPSFSAIATRYRHQPGLRDVLLDKIRYGGKQHWGERFNMWPQTNLSDEDAYELVDWILKQ